MKKVLLTIALVVSTIAGTVTSSVAAYNFGDFRSQTLIGKAWQALEQNDIEAVLVYTNKNLELYADQAKEMQASLTKYPTGTNDEIFSYWALNDVATGLFIQGEAYRKAEMNTEASDAYQKVIDTYSFGQAWDTKGWFWKPAEASKEKLAMIKSGSKIDFGDYSSSYLTTQAWRALNKNPDEALIYTNKVIELYGSKAKTMQSQLTEYPWESKEKIFSYWALNDVGTSYFIQGEAFKKAGSLKDATSAYRTLVDEFYYAQCWDPQGWFWKPADAAQSALEEFGEI